LTFLASIERTNLAWSALFGLASGLAILGKYYAGLIVLACALAALLHPQRRSYLRSPRPYLAVLICALVLAPNLYWLAEHDFISIRLHVAEERSTDHPLAVVAHALTFVGAFVALSSTALLAFWLCLRPWSAAMARSLVADWRGVRAAVACITIAPVVLPLALLVPAGILLHSPWNAPAFFFVPLSVIAYSQLKPNENNRASSLTNLFRNWGGSFGISFATALSERRQSFHQSVMAANLPASGAWLQNFVQRTTNYLMSQGYSHADAMKAAYLRYYEQLGAQTRLLGFMDVFRTIGWLTLAVTPLVFLISRFQAAKGGASANH